MATLCSGHRFFSIRRSIAIGTLRSSCVPPRQTEQGLHPGQALTNRPPRRLPEGRGGHPVSMWNSLCFTMEHSMNSKSESCELLIIDDDPEVLLAAELVLKKHFQSVT